MVTTLTAILVAYLIGAVPFGLLIARAFGVGDIRTVGSGNIGATNVLRTLGMKAAIWVYLLDVGKGAAVVLVARGLNQTWLRPDLFLVLVGLAAIFGHVFPIYLKFKGGKGVATSAGVLAVLLPLETLLAAGVFFVVMLASRYVSVASIAAALTLPVAITVERSLLDQEVSPIYWTLAVVIGLFVPLTHLRNIRRLLEGTENRFSLTRRKGGAGA